MVNFNEWLKEMRVTVEAKEMRVKVEAKEMVHGFEVAESGKKENLRGKHGQGDKERSHSFNTGGAVGGGKETKPPCGFCEGNHGVWSSYEIPGVGSSGEVECCEESTVMFSLFGNFHQGRHFNLI